MPVNSGGQVPVDCKSVSLLSAGPVCVFQESESFICQI